MTKQPQVEPVAQVVSMREIITGFGVTKHVEIAALRAEGLELGAELYTHADPGEVERLRERHEAWTAGVEQGKQESQSELSQLREDFDIAKNEDLKWQGLREQEAEIKALRTQLAEAHTLLREAACHATRMEPMTASCLNRIDAHLDASTAPSAPAEQNARKKKKSSYHSIMNFKSSTREQQVQAVYTTNQSDLETAATLVKLALRGDSVINRPRRLTKTNK